jgi:exopolysaccharide production protein ExoZ
MQGVHNFRYSTVVGHFFSIVGNFGVDIFFVISGFIMFYTLKRDHYSAREFLLRRILRIVPVYWLMTLAFIPIIYAFPSPFASRFDWDISSLALSLLFIPHQNPSGLGEYPLLTVGWSLNFEMFF